ncbi:SusE domain-containing protein [Pontibacter anaerobius]|uniref:SusE domain-containing protein n=1 Tax=Pontibacter anaerobius TaxID=2993940 RepID=A0ABT3RFN0_9BACT|nr:SusE domain-containing protein [Pontibacter anaerobius]MCX2740311.1 SusE domain-containing protein [Pontibacter anaerobius]
MFFVAALALVSCEKDEDKAFVREGTAPALTVSTNSLVLTEEEAENEALTLSWNAADFGYEAAVEYWLEIDTAGDNFVKPYSVSLGSSFEKVYTVAELNTLLTKLKYTPEETHDVDVRIKSTISDLRNPVYSNTQNISVTTYSTYVEPGYVYVPGDYQGWSPETAPSLISVEDNGIYQGVISFNNKDNNLKFKITAGRSWETNYGGGSAAGTLAQNGPDLSVPKKDSYRITADLNNMTWTAAQYSWGLIGDATPGKWADDTNMIYDNEEGVWRLTIQLTAGNIKFRLNDDWTTNYGDNGGDKVLELNGADIPVSEAGTYEIVLDLENEDESVTYTITKL